MDIEDLTDDEVVLIARALSIHRVSMRRKLDRMQRGSPEYAGTVSEIGTTQRIIAKLNTADLDRISA